MAYTAQADIDVLAYAAYTTSDPWPAADANDFLDAYTALSDNIVAVIGADAAPTRDMETLNTDLAVVEAAGIPYQRYGLELSNAADTDHDITIAAGQCSSSAFDLTLILSAAMTKRIDAAWAAGTGNGGLFSGAVGNTTWYAVHLIRKDADGSIDAGFDTSATAANIPAGYTYYRRIGYVLTDGAANIIGFYQTMNRIYWKVPIEDVSTANPGVAAVLSTLSVPPSMVALLNAAVFSLTQADHFGLVTSPSATDTAPSATYCTIYSYKTENYRENNYMDVLADSNSQVRYRISASDANTTVKILTIGWIDTGI